MVEKQNIVESILSSTTELVRTENLIVDAMHDLIRDEIKKYVRQKLETNPELKKELKNAVAALIDAKTKEAFALLKIAKCVMKLGLELVPPQQRDEMLKEIISLFEKEIGTVIEKTL